MGFSIDTAQQVLAKFADICVNDNGKWYGDLALYFAECATDFTLGYGDIDEDFYEVLGDAYHEAIVAAGQDEELYKLWKVQFTASSGRHSVLERPFSETNGRPFFS